MPESVRGGFRRQAHFFAKVLHNSLGFANWQAAVVLPDENRREPCGGEAALGVEVQELGHAGLSDVVERDDPGLSGFGLRSGCALEVGGEVEFVPWGSIVGDQVDGPKR